jgi:hypothetical protein
MIHKVLTYVEYRAVSSKILTPQPLSVSVSSLRTKGGSGYTLGNYCDISMQYYAAKNYKHNCTYAMSRNILNVPTGTHFAGFFYTN